MEEAQLSIATTPQNIFPTSRGKECRVMEVFVNGQLKGYALLYPLTIIIALSYQLDSMEAHLFRKHLCRELQRPLPVVEQIYLHCSDSIN